MSRRWMPCRAGLRAISATRPSGQEYAQALPLLQKASAVGNTDAMDLLGQLYENANAARIDVLSSIMR
jgi:TPR repeat protein